MPTFNPFPYQFRSAVIAAMAITGWALWISPLPAAACPFCGAVKSTLTQEIKSSDVAVIARMTALPDAPDAKPGELNIATPMAQFEVVDIIKGKDTLEKTKSKQFSAPFFADEPVVGAKFMFEGTVQPEGIIWSPPIAVTRRSHQYLLDLARFREDDPARLIFLQDFLGDSEQLLSADAYDEFALAPYSALKAIKSKMPHDKLVDRIRNLEETASKRRLYLTMLGVCGGEKDLPMLEELLRSKEPKFKTGLDATIACYLVLKGADGLSLIEKLFLEKDTDEYTDIFAVVMALRTLGQEKGAVPLDKIVASMRKVLDHPKVADQAITDLARWEDWTVMDRLVEMFKSNDPEVVSWVRVPVITYLRACPLPKAKEYVEELRKIDPKAVKQSETLYAVGPEPQDPTGAPPAAATRATAKQAEKKTESGDGSRETGVKEIPAPTEKSANDTNSRTAPAKSDTSQADSRGEDTSPQPTSRWLIYGIAAIVGALVISAVARGQRS